MTTGSSRLRSATATIAATLLVVACGSSDSEVEGRPSFDPATTVEELDAADDDTATTEAAPTTEPDTGDEPDDGSSDGVEDDGVEDDGVEGDGAATTVAEDQAPATDTGDAVDGEPDDGSGDAAGGGEDASCLVGSWIVDETELNAWYDALAENSGLGAEIDTIGTAEITFTDTEFTYVGDFDVEILFQGAEGTGSSSGSASGSWSAASGAIVTTDVESDLGASVVLGDAVIEGSTIGNGFDTVDPIAGAPYDCDGPTLSFQAGPDDTFRHVVTLTPA